LKNGPEANAPRTQPSYAQII